MVGSIGVAGLVHAWRVLRDPSGQARAPIARVPALLERLCPRCGRLDAGPGPRAPLCPRCGLPPGQMGWVTQAGGVDQGTVFAAALLSGVGCLGVFMGLMAFSDPKLRWWGVALYLGLALLLCGVGALGPLGVVQDQRRRWRRRGHHQARVLPGAGPLAVNVVARAHLDRRGVLREATGTATWSPPVPAPRELSTIGVETLAALRVLARLQWFELLFVRTRSTLRWRRRPAPTPVGTVGYRGAPGEGDWECDEQTTVSVVLPEESHDEEADDVRPLTENERRVRELLGPDGRRDQPLADLLARLVADPALRASLGDVAAQASGGAPGREAMDRRAGELAAMAAS
ncbi:MAG: hypothetical protein EOO75_02870 [Myxococcales bacterium]|nr:MAG: hypothetical protein EOO75_02870 [Myxococcales bacterium]